MVQDGPVCSSPPCAAELIRQGELLPPSLLHKPCPRQPMFPWPVKLPACARFKVRLSVFSLCTGWFTDREHWFLPFPILPSSQQINIFPLLYTEWNGGHHSLSKTCVRKDDQISAWWGCLYFRAKQILMQPQMKWDQSQLIHTSCKIQGLPCLFFFHSYRAPSLLCQSSCELFCFLLPCATSKFA